MVIELGGRNGSKCMVIFKELFWLTLASLDLHGQSQLKKVITKDPVKMTVYFESSRNQFIWPLSFLAANINFTVILLQSILLAWLATECRLKWCWWRRNIGDVLLETVLRCCWQNYNVGYPFHYVTNISNPVSNIRHQHWCDQLSFAQKPKISAWKIFELFGLILIRIDFSVNILYWFS